jgi:hypothetical protein
MSILKNFSFNNYFMWNRAFRQSHVNGRATQLAALLRRICCGLGRRSVAAGALEHLAHLPLTAHASLALVRMDKQRLLLGITPQNITLLSKIDDESDSAPQGVALRSVAFNDESFPEAAGRAR